MERLDELEKRINSLEKRVVELENNKERDSPEITNLEKLIIEKISSVKSQEIVILILYLKPKQTKKQIMSTLQKFGATKKMLNWFNGGNFKQRLVNAGIVYEIKEENKDVTYSLTEGLGKQKVMTIINNLKKTY